MHVRELVELGALVAPHASAFVRRSNPLIERHMAQYWQASRCRQDRWLRTLCDFRRLSTAKARATWPRVCPVIEEILAGELLTRVWAAVARGLDRSHRSDTLEPIARSVLVGHAEARNLRCTCWFAAADWTRMTERHCEVSSGARQRWTDMMLGYLILDFDAAQFAFDTRRDRLRERPTSRSNESQEAPSGDIGPRVTPSRVSPHLGPRLSQRGPQPADCGFGPRRR